jgi:hypothetical protein
MEVIKEAEKEEMAHLNLSLPAVAVRRYHALVARGNKMHPRIKVVPTLARHFMAGLDELETDMNSMTVKPLRQASKPED